MKKNIRKIIAAGLCLPAFLTASVSAKEYETAYNKFMVNTLIPRSGFCDTTKSYVGHESEDIYSYYSGVISAFTNDIDGDGDAELFVVKNNIIEIYGAHDDESITHLDDIKQNLLCTDGRSYANVFIKPCGMERFLCIEYFNDTGSSMSYSMKVYSMDKETKKISSVPRAKIEKQADDEYVSESVSGIHDGEPISYSSSNVNGNDYVVNKNNYKDCVEPARLVLEGAGFINTDFIVSPLRLDLFGLDDTGNYRISKYLNDVEPQTYIRTENIRNGGTPVVSFDDYSMLEKLTSPVTEIKVTVNGEEVQFQGQNPVIIDGRTLVPVRGVFEALGAEVNWIGDEKKVIIFSEDVNISMKLNSDRFYVNGDEKKLDVPASLIDDRTMVPVRAISESLGCQVDWDDESKTVVISTYEQ